MGGGSDDLFTEMSSKWWAMVVTIVLMKCPVNLFIFMQITPYKAWEATVV